MSVDNRQVFEMLDKAGNMNRLVPVFNRWAVKTKTLAGVNIMRRAKKPTGRLAGSITERVDIHNKNITARVQTSLPYANWIEYGGKWGFKGYHYLRDSARTITPKTIEEIKKVITK